QNLLCYHYTTRQNAIGPQNVNRPLNGATRAFSTRARLPSPRAQLPLPSFARFPLPTVAPAPASRRSCDRHFGGRDGTGKVFALWLRVRAKRPGLTRHVPSRCVPDISHQCIGSR